MISYYILRMANIVNKIFMIPFEIVLDLFTNANRCFSIIRDKWCEQFGKINLKARQNLFPKNKCTIFKKNFKK